MLLILGAHERHYSQLEYRVTEDGLAKVGAHTKQTFRFHTLFGLRDAIRACKINLRFRPRVYI